MRRQISLCHEAYVFWTAVTDFRLQMRNGLPVDKLAFCEDISIIREMSDYPQIKLRCEAVAAVYAQIPMRLLP